MKIKFKKGLVEVETKKSIYAFGDTKKKAYRVTIDNLEVTSCKEIEVTYDYFHEIRLSDIEEDENYLFKLSEEQKNELIPYVQKLKIDITKNRRTCEHEWTYQQNYSWVGLQEGVHKTCKKCGKQEHAGGGWLPKYTNEGDGKRVFGAKKELNFGIDFMEF